MAKYYMAKNQPSSIFLLYKHICTFVGNLLSLSSHNPNQVDGRKWEDLNIECLVNVFGRVGIESLILDVPLVCKSWYKATINPLCWRNLVFPEFPRSWPIKQSRLVDAYGSYDFPITAFIKYVVDRSCGCATMIKLPNGCKKLALFHVADKCPNIKTLGLPSNTDYNTIPKIIYKWKNLEALTLHNVSKMREILTQISIHCNNFVALCVTRSEIDKQEALVIVELLPNLKSFGLTYDYVAHESLLIILKGCRDLVEIDVRGSYGFEVDDEILKLASHINDFKYENSLALDGEEIFSSFILGYESSSSSISDG